MKKDFVIASDLDGTIIDHTEHKVMLTRKYGHRIDAAHTSSEAMKKVLGIENYHELQQELYGELTRSAPSMPGASEALLALNEQFGAIHIISQRAKRNNEKYGDKVQYALEWIHSHIAPPIDAEHVFFVEREEEKDTIARELGVNVYIDDRESVLASMPSVEHRFLFYPYEDEFKSKHHMVRSWGEFKEYLMGF